MLIIELKVLVSGPLQGFMIQDFKVFDWFAGYASPPQQLLAFLQDLQQWQVLNLHSLQVERHLL